MQLTYTNCLLGASVLLGLVVPIKGETYVNEDGIVETVEIEARQTTSTSYTSDAEFKSEMLAAHNFFRAQHNATALIWSDGRAKTSTDYANQCIFKHSVS